MQTHQSSLLSPQRSQAKLHLLLGASAGAVAAVKQPGTVHMKGCGEGNFTKNCQLYMTACPGSSRSAAFSAMPAEYDM